MTDRRCTNGERSVQNLAVPARSGGRVLDYGRVAKTHGPLMRLASSLSLLRRLRMCRCRRALAAAAEELWYAAIARLRARVRRFRNVRRAAMDDWPCWFTPVFTIMMDLDAGCAVECRGTPDARLKEGKAGAGGGLRVQPNVSTGLYDTLEHLERFNVDSVTKRAADVPVYDRAGNLTYDGVRRLEYDAWNRLVAVRHAFRDDCGDVQAGRAWLTMRYDGRGRRIVKNIDGTGQLDCTVPLLL